MDNCWLRQEMFPTAEQIMYHSFFLAACIIEVL